MAQFKGNTTEQGVFLGAWFWKEGVNINGKIVGFFSTEIGRNAVLELTIPVSVPSLKVRAGTRHAPDLNDFSNVLVSTVSIGGLKGFQSVIENMAEANPNFGTLQIGDVLDITCTGTRDTGQASPMIEFAVDVTRK